MPPGACGTLARMPCLILILVLASPRLVLALMFFLSTYLERAYHGILIPILGFIFSAFDDACLCVAGEQPLTACGSQSLDFGYRDHRRCRRSRRRRVSPTDALTPRWYFDN